MKRFLAKQKKHFGEKARTDTRRTMGKRIYEMPESLSGLSDYVAGMERKVQTQNKNRRMER